MRQYLEVITTNVDVMLEGQINYTRNKGVLWAAIDVWDALEDTSDGEYGRRRDLRLSLLNGLKKIGGSVVHTCDEACTSSKTQYIMGGEGMGWDERKRRD